MKWIVVDDPMALGGAAAQRLLAVVSADPSAVLGLPTGRTPEGMYLELRGHCHPEQHCFSGVTTFNLDEYVGIGSDHPGSYCTYMKRNLFDHVDLDRSRIHVPDGLATKVRSANPQLPFQEALALECRSYEEAIVRAGGLDLTFLGLGTNGHIGFNEPGSTFETRTRVVELSPSTRASNAPLFPDQEVPSQAITMGIGTILESRAIVLLASGLKKREAIERLRSGKTDLSFPASALHLHGDVTVIVDRAAGSGL